MRKFFENPTMDITRFDTENVITASGAQGQRSPQDADQLTEAGYTVKTIDVKEFDFTF